MVSLALLLFVATWLALPFVPAIQEAVRHRDGGALPISDHYREDVRVPPQPNDDPDAAPPSDLLDFGRFTGLATDVAEVGGAVRLGPNTTIRQRLTAATTVTADAGSSLGGSVEAGTSIHLAPGCQFERLHAPVIHIGPAPTVPAVLVDASTPCPLPEGVEVLADRALICSDFTVPAGTFLVVDLVVTGSLVVEPGACLLGDVKAHGNLRLASRAHVMGHAVSGASLILEDGARILGAAIAEDVLQIGPGAGVGRPSKLTSATGRNIVIASGGYVHGTLWAQEAGLTVESIHAALGASV